MMSESNTADSPQVKVQNEDVSLCDQQKPPPAHGEHGSVKVQNGDVSLCDGRYKAAEVLREIATKANISLIHAADLPQVEVMVVLNRISPNNAVKAVATAAGWEVIEDGAVFRVQVSPQSQSQTQPQSSALPPSESQGRQSQTQPQSSALPPSESQKIWGFRSLLVAGGVVLLLLVAITVVLLYKGAGTEWKDVLPLGIVALLLAFIVWAIVKICQPE